MPRYYINVTPACVNSPYFEDYWVYTDRADTPAELLGLVCWGPLKEAEIPRDSVDAGKVADAPARPFCREMFGPEPGEIYEITEH